MINNYLIIETKIAYNFYNKINIKVNQKKIEILKYHIIIFIINKNLIKKTNMLKNNQT